MVNTITKRQSDFLVKLIEERDLGDEESSVETLREMYRERTATAKAASDVISRLLLRPKKHTVPLTPGIYEGPDAADLYRVYLGQNSGRMLCKRVVIDPASKELAYVYVGAARRVLQGARRLTRQEVAERTLSYGSAHCMICGRRLDDPESVDRGVGPVCWENYA